MKRALIFGINGFVGQYLMTELKNAGYELFGSDIVLNQFLPDYVQFSACDILDAKAVSKLVEKIQPTHLINLAAISSVGMSWKNPQKTIAVNVEGILNILEAVRHNAMETKILLIGSSEEYASSPNPIQEDFPLNSSNPYGLSKVVQEQFRTMYNQQYHMQIYYARAFNHIGVGQSPGFVLSGWCQQSAQIALSGKPGTIEVGNIDVARDFSDVRDVVRAYRMIMESDCCEAVYNVGSATAHPLRELVQYIASLSEQPVDIKINPALFRPTDNPFICCDNSLIKRSLGWNPQFIIEETIRDMFENYKKILTS